MNKETMEVTFSQLQELVKNMGNKEILVVELSENTKEEEKYGGEE